MSRGDESGTGPPRRSPRVGIIGLGVIGGSLALRLVEQGIETHGFATAPADTDAAGAAGVLIAPTIEGAVANADILVLAVPLDALAPVAASVIRAARPRTTIMHVCSLQRADAARLTRAAAECVIGTHPLAGNHGTGFRAASAGLLAGATVYAEPRAQPRTRADIEWFWTRVGAGRIEYMDPDEHDRLMARVSHLPQLVSTALASVLARRGVGLDQLGPGAQGSTRLAGSSLSVWWPLLDRAPSETADLLGEMQRVLGDLQHACAARDHDRVAAMWNLARHWRTEEVSA